ncbi:hypothetical protein BABINDRAFT_30875 [Babjeviella inositovora NRRL Y-12698]|uniref:Glutamate decarboxylase n=1 Tax=Babjeviella inositovora NRRL Y-12698 TaxID=984486 RepID=A0A1E3QYW0_9ASCO|nr:uncharacterized protein BABINDRAFT_30875 [Babjeviella inositovora NRRL Y-12698]ODQ82272.1 hypothetical protein BABINDRAFT_30875 [Babjeviella inositovora NRRL Y-12698]
MTLSKHVDAEKMESSLLKATRNKFNVAKTDRYLSSYNANVQIPKYSIPQDSTLPELVSQLLQSELTLDGNPTLNLASFVNTHIDPEAAALVASNLVKNLADNDEYPALLDIHQRCVSIISGLWHGNAHKAVGSATTGSSEAIMLGGLAMKKTWQNKRKAAGKDISNPNILMATCAQVALEKFARYFDVEDRLIPVCAESDHMIDVSKIRENVDENTIGIFVIVGSTFTGGFEPVKEISELLDTIQKETGIDVPIHVDGASGGFVAPFVFPDLEWDFRVPRVVSINTSGHKFGLVTAGLGWIIFRDAAYLPESLKFQLDYLGGIEETFTLNFSRPGFPVIHQYYNFLKLGRKGYTDVFKSCLQNARLLANCLDYSEYFTTVSNIHKPILGGVVSKDLGADEKFNPGLPVVSFRFSDEFVKEYPEIPQSIISQLLRAKGWIVPNYKLPPSESNIEILRVVVRDSVTLDLLDKLLSDIIDLTEKLIHSVQLIRNMEGKDVKQNTSDIYAILYSMASEGKVTIADIQKNFAAKDSHPSSGKPYRATC